MEYKVEKTVGANSYTGSIERVYSLADGLEADSTGSNALARVEFGRFTPGEQTHLLLQFLQQFIFLKEHT